LIKTLNKKTTYIRGFFIHGNIIKYIFEPSYY